MFHANRHLLRDNEYANLYKAKVHIQMLVKSFAIFLLLSSQPLLANLPESQTGSGLASSGKQDIQKTASPGESNRVESGETQREGHPSEGEKPREASDEPARGDKRAYTGPRVFKARLKGSMCQSCLLQLEKSLKSDLEGVDSAKVTRTEETAEVNAGEETKRFARIEVVYSSPRLNARKIRKFIERHDFGIKDETDAKGPSTDLEN